MYIEKLESVNVDLKINETFFKITTDALELSNFAIEIIEENKIFGNILDIGAGTGILSFLLLKSKFINKIDSIEIQNELASELKNNILNNKLENKINCINLDIKLFEGDKYEYIISNPPYFPVDSGKLPENTIKKISKFEIKLKIEELIFEIKRLLKQNGNFFLILPKNRELDVLKFIKNNNLSIVKIKTIGKKNKQFILIHGVNK